MQRYQKRIEDLDPDWAKLAETVEEIAPQHQPRTASIAGMEHACVTCDEVWPCPTANVIAGFLKTKIRLANIELRIRELAGKLDTARVVYKTWRNTMTRQDRLIKLSQQSWEELELDDKIIDQNIAIAVVEHVLEELAKVKPR